MLQFPKEPKSIRERIRSYERVLCKERETFAGAAPTAWQDRKGAVPRQLARDGPFVPKERGA